MSAVQIEDQPRFRWRGMMLDVGRHFFPVADIKQMIDAMALHKLNTFHWHLTDDQGWRIEIRRYPKLTEVGAWRKETLVGRLTSDKATDLKYDGRHHGGFYTQDDIREIVEYARDRHVNVVPEIELPGHAQAAIAAYPELGCTGEHVEVLSKWGVSPYLFSVREQTLTFLEDVLTEVMALSRPDTSTRAETRLSRPVESQRRSSGQNQGAGTQERR